MRGELGAFNACLHSSLQIPSARKRRTLEPHGRLIKQKRDGLHVRIRVIMHCAAALNSLARPARLCPSVAAWT